MFIIGLPLTVCLVLFLPYMRHLALNLVIIFLSGLGAAEFAHMLKHKGLIQSIAPGANAGAAQEGGA
jgi:phosphatidate cytidylyltransferase